MSKIPPPTDTITNRINKHHEDHQEPPRLHFGLSQAGHHCERWLWLNFRLSVVEKHQGRILRIFRRGHNEEFPMVEDLKNAGLSLRHTGADQKRVIASALVSGSLDGIIDSGVPEAPKAAHVLEMKTMGEKAFKDIVKNGLEKSKPIYWVQCQSYMLLSFPINRALFMAVNKNTDELYTERVKLDKKTAQYFIDRAVRISESDRIPVPCSSDPTWYQCKWCAGHSMCFGDKLSREINCRTCSHSTPSGERGWVCERWDSEVIPGEHQRVGCRSHVFHPDLVPWEMGEAVDDWTARWIIGGEAVANGESGYSSKEVLAMVGAGIGFNNPGIDKVREVFEGEVLGKEPKKEPEQSQKETQKAEQKKEIELELF